MKIKIDWQEPILLFRHRRRVYTKETIHAIDCRLGVYYFARIHGKKKEPFYIGETKNLRVRITDHLKSANILDILRGNMNQDAVRIAQGSRYFHYGYLIGTFQDAKKRLRIVQQYLIDEALAQGLTLLNKQTSVVRPHLLVFEGSPDGRGIYPKSAAVDPSR